METLFAGSYVTVAGEVRVGDYVEFDTAQEGLATDIGRRTAWIWMHQNTIAVVLNMPLAESIITRGRLAEPFVRFIRAFGEFSLNFTLICRVRELVDHFLVQHELRKRIFRRFRKEGVEIPFPIRTVYIRDAREAKETLGT
ncbi:MAG: hypothetical protein ACE5H0_01030 [Bacteroidota bacterium]